MVPYSPLISLVHFYFQNREDVCRVLYWNYITQINGTYISLNFALKTLLKFHVFQIKKRLIKFTASSSFFQCKDLLQSRSSIFFSDVLCFYILLVNYLWYFHNRVSTTQCDLYNHPTLFFCPHTTVIFYVLSNLLSLLRSQLFW